MLPDPISNSWMVQSSCCTTIFMDTSCQTESLYFPLEEHKSSFSFLRELVRNLGQNLKPMIHIPELLYKTLLCFIDFLSSQKISEGLQLSVAVQKAFFFSI